MRKTFAVLALLAVTAPAFAAEVDDGTAIAIARPQELIVDRSLPADAVKTMLTPVDAFYGFWNNSSRALLDQAVATTFTDHTLPPGRPQGPSGPAAASKAFLAAVPDLKIAVVQRLVVGDRVASHLRFTGRFTGRFMGHAGKGQAIDFIATDIVTVKDGRITDNWHLEDNLTFMRQAGLLPKGS